MSTRAIAILFLCAFGLGTIVAAAHPARGQDGHHGVGHAEMHGAYETWKDHKGYGCCDDRDCRPVRANLIGDGRWSVWIDGRWLPVPPDAVLPIPSPDGRSHVCMAPSALEPRCFVPGEVRG